jgi:type IV pilus assembly protein PilB
MLSEADIVIAALLEEQRVTPEGVERAKRRAAESGVNVLDALVSLGLMSASDVAITRAVVCEVPFVDPSRFEIDLRNCARLPRAIAEALGAFPLFVIDQVATVGMLNPLDLRAVDQLRAVLKIDVEPVLCERTTLLTLIERAYALAAGGAESENTTARDAVNLTTGKEPIVAAVNQIIMQAVERGASDIHIGPDEQQLHLRYRIDGTLQPQQGPSLSAHAGIVQRLKVMANLDLTQTRRPQDGKFRFMASGRSVDVRVSLIPTVCGENVVLRLLASGGSIKGFGELGMNPRDSGAMQDLLDSPNGMILATGPTGSGKTTTLYAALKHINSPDLNIVTIEDPVEIRLPLVRQVQVNTEIGMTFAGALRSILRQDPDVVLVGEIRDEETARIAMQAALTGHLVLSSLHTNDAPGAISRLRNFGVPSFAINSAVLCAIAQRLAKRVCESCAKPDEADANLLGRFGMTQRPAHLRRGAGCPKCASTGFRGRVGLYEFMRMTTALQGAVDADLAGAKLRRAALDAGMVPMWRDGLEKASLGQTTLDEVLRVAGSMALDADPADREARLAA